MDPSDWRTIRSASLFASMPPEVVQGLAGNRGSRSYEKGAMIFHQGEMASAFFLVLDGWVKVYRTTPDGLEVVLHVLRRGETFAESAIFGGGRYPTSAETVSAARLLRIDGDAFKAQICDRPELALSMLASASHQLDRLTEQIEQIKVRSAPQRIAAFLIRLTPVRKGPAELELPFEKALIANRLGMKPESFSRALGKLKAQGIAVARETVRIADVARLLAFVEYSEDGA
jgi:CRP/FNR family transcriptional regulator, dissimilatory nitrate respiration regulator